MKYNFIISAFLAVSLSLNAQLPSLEAPSKNELKISPIQFGKSYFEFSFEHYFQDRKKSFVISPMLMLKDNGYDDFKGIQLETQYRVYLKDLNKQDNATWIFSDISFYTGGYLSGMLYEEKADEYYYDDIIERNGFETITTDIKAGEMGVFLGAKFIISKRVVLDFTVGGGIRYSDLVEEMGEYNDQYYRNSYNVFDIGYTGVKPKVNFQLGITL